MKEVCLSIKINTTPEKVWDTLTAPEKIKQYMYGCDTVSDWQEGGTVDYYMEEDGKREKMVYGNIIKNEEGKYLEHSLFPCTWKGMEDIPENHIYVSYKIEPDGNSSKLTIRQWGFENAAEGETRYEHSKNGWNTLLEKLKEVAEG